MRSLEDGYRFGHLLVDDAELRQAPVQWGAERPRHLALRRELEADRCTRHAQRLEDHRGGVGDGAVEVGQKNATH
jgi:hypothetical protein